MKAVTQKWPSSWVSHKRPLDLAQIGPWLQEHLPGFYKLEVNSNHVFSIEIRGKGSGRIAACSLQRARKGSRAEA
jgi:hypothetical protein